MDLTGNLGVGRDKMSWDFVPCPSNLLEGGQQFYVKEGSSVYWLAVQLRNANGGVTGMTMNGSPGKRMDYNYFLWESGTGGSDCVSVEASLDGGSKFLQKIKPAQGTAQAC